jgi:hypothetical protein
MQKGRRSFENKMKMERKGRPGCRRSFLIDWAWHLRRDKGEQGEKEKEMKTSKGRMDRGKGKEGVRAKGNEREKKQ